MKLIGFNTGDCATVTVEPGDSSELRALLNSWCRKSSKAHDGVWAKKGAVPGVYTVSPQAAKQLRGGRP